MLFIRATNLGREKELKIFKILEKVQFKNPFPETKIEPEIREETDSKECTVPGNGRSTIRGTKVNGVWQGPFTKTYPDGSRWEGTYVNGHVDKKLSYIYASGARMDGEWHDRKWNGPGTYYCDKGVLRGIWKDGKIAGDAVYTYEDGTEYVGAIRDYLRHGMGTITFPGGAKLKGAFAEDRASGPVEIDFPNGDRYKGEWCDNITGNGEYFSACCPNIQNLHYHGSWVEGEMCGTRRGEWGNLSLRINKGTEYIYKGEWKNGNANGEGYLQCRRDTLAAETIGSGLFTGSALVSGDKSLEVRTAESFMQAAARHIRRTIAQGLSRER